MIRAAALAALLLCRVFNYFEGNEIASWPAHLSSIGSNFKIIDRKTGISHDIAKLGSILISPDVSIKNLAGDIEFGWLVRHIGLSGVNRKLVICQFRSFGIPWSQNWPNRFRWKTFEVGPITLRNSVAPEANFKISRGRFSSIADEADDSSARLQSGVEPCIANIDVRSKLIFSLSRLPRRVFRGMPKSALSDQPQERGRNKKQTRESRGRVCPEFLPPPLVVFGIAAAMFALSGYVKGMRGTIFGICGFIWIALFLFGDWWSRWICYFW